MALKPVEYAYAGEFGLLFCEDEAGKHWTSRGPKASLDMVLAAKGVGQLGGVEIDAKLFPHTREGWPDEW